MGQILSSKREGGQKIGKKKINEKYKKNRGNLKP
jgi:hypothetical protein